MELDKIIVGKTYIHIKDGRKVVASSELLKSGTFTGVCVDPGNIQGEFEPFFASWSAINFREPIPNHITGPVEQRKQSFEDLPDEVKARKVPEIYDMDLHKRIFINDGDSLVHKIVIIRVPGGWIYRLYGNPVFVPFNKEYLDNS